MAVRAGAVSDDEGEGYQRGKHRGGQNGDSSQFSPNVVVGRRALAPLASLASGLRDSLGRWAGAGGGNRRLGLLNSVRRTLNIYRSLGVSNGSNRHRSFAAVLLMIAGRCRWDTAGTARSLLPAAAQFTLPGRRPATFSGHENAPPSEVADTGRWRIHGAIRGHFLSIKSNYISISPKKAVRYEGSIKEFHYVAKAAEGRDTAVLPVGVRQKPRQPGGASGFKLSVFRIEH